MDTLNSTAAPEMAPGGEQAEVVAQQETESPTERSGAGRAEAVAPQRNSDFDLVDVGEDDAEDPKDSAGKEQNDTPADLAAEAKPDGAGQAAKEKVKQQPSTGKAASVLQSAQENAVYHLMRLRARREAEAEARARLDAEIAGLGIEDPYNAGRTLNNLNDLRAYSENFRKGKIAAEAKKTGRSVSELEEEAANRAFLSSLRRTADQNAAKSAAQAAVESQQARQAQERKAFIDADVLDFVRQYPEMDADGLAALENNRQFREFCGTRFGREPLAKLYDSYVKLIDAAGTAAVTKASERRARSTGSGTGGGAVLSPAQKIELDQWNADHPEMAMTAREFLGR